MIKRYLRAAIQGDAALHLMLINQRLPKDFMQSRACIDARGAYSAYRADQGGTQMGIILGIDVGGSTTKIVGLTPGGELISTMTVRAYDQITSLYGALGHYINANKFSLSDVERILVTGVGSSYLSGDIYGIPTQRIEEFSAIARGGLALAGLDEAVVVSMGTGTAFIHAHGKDYSHIGGSGVGVLLQNIIARGEVRVCLRVGGRVLHTGVLLFCGGPVLLGHKGLHQRHVVG